MKPDNDSVGYLKDILPHYKYWHNQDFDIAVGTLIHPFKPEPQDADIIYREPGYLIEYNDNIYEPRVCQLALLMGMGERALFTDPSLVLLYAEIYVTTNTKRRPVVFLPPVYNFGFGDRKEENVGAPLVCLHPGYRWVQYGVCKYGHAVLVEYMMDFVTYITREYKGKKPRFTLTNRTSGNRIEKTRSLASPRKATYGLLVCGMVLLFVK